MIDGVGTSSEGALRADTLNSCRRIRNYLAKMAVVAFLYFCGGKLGLSFAFINESASSIWPPTGLSLAVLLLFGYRMWPAIFIGAFLVNLTTAGNVITSLGIATGNTLEAYVGALLTNKYAHGRNAFDRLSDLFKFTVLGGIFSTTISATVGLMTLAYAGFAPWSQFWRIWLTWWLGDVGGALVITPLITLWWKDRSPCRTEQALEVSLLCCTVFVIANTVFGPLLFDASRHYAVDFICIGIPLWTAFRFGSRETALASFVLGVFAIVGTLNGYGPFVSDTPNEALLLLQAFLAFSTIVGLSVAAVVAQRRSTEHRLEIQYIAARELVQTRNLEEAAHVIVQEIGERFNWDSGAFWVVDHQHNTAHCCTFWRGKDRGCSAFERQSFEQPFTQGVGLPGRVWVDKKPAWIEELSLDNNFPRAKAAKTARFKCGFAFPILIDRDKCVGILEFFSRQSRARDNDLMRMLSALGNQMGQFLALKSAEITVRTSESRNRAILESALDCIVTMDSSGRITEFNPAAERTFGFKKEEILGKLVAETLIPERLRRDHTRGLSHFLATGTGPVLQQRVEMPALRSDGTEFPVELAIVAIPEEQGNFFFTAYLRDLTDRKALESALVQRAEELAAADRSKDEFLAMLSHELRNPLSTIATASQLAGRARARVHNDLIHQTIQRQVKHLARLIDDLLDVSRITRGKIQLQREHVELVSLVRNAVDSVRSLFEQKRQKMTLAIVDDSIWLDADPTRIEQIFVNLLTNASKYTDHGGKIELSVTRREKEAAITFRDNGIGITHDMISRVFDPFIQGDHSLDRSQGGLGVGLTLVEKLVKIHGGTVRVFSEGAGKGSEFVVMLPILYAHPQPIEIQKRTAGDRSISGRRILIVDDNVDSASMLASLLESTGNTVWLAQDGLEALDQVTTHEPEVVLLDIGLPGIDGYQVASEVRKNKRLKDTLIVAISGYGQQEDLARSTAAGCNHHLVKPIDYDVLVEVLRRELITATH